MGKFLSCCSQAYRTAFHGWTTRVHSPPPSPFRAKVLHLYASCKSGSGITFCLELMLILKKFNNGENKKINGF